MLDQAITSDVATKKTKEEWLRYLETCHFKSIHLGLDRIRIVAARLGVVNFECPIITVAGTNGKGSCVELLKTILMAAGYRVGTYTSPHLLEYNERIQISGQWISDCALCDAFTQIEKIREDTSLTYFEFSTLAALCWFKQAQLDAIILEVGLGGRLDAVNCVDSDIAVISMVDLDHREWLGNTREAIAKEKAGIIRATKPCVLGDFLFSQSVYAQARLLNSPLYQQGQAFDYKSDTSTWSWRSQQQTLLDLPLPGIDLQNAATVLQVIELLSSQFLILRSAIEKGLRQVFLPGRFHCIEKNSIKIILDVAHNPAGGRCLARRLAKMPGTTGEIYAIVGMLADKDIGNTLLPLVYQIDHWFLTSLENHRGATADEISQFLLEKMPSASLVKFSSPRLAYQQACQQLRKGDCLLVFGSFHTVEPILREVA